MSDSPVTQAAETATGVPDGALPDSRVLLILAADHRDSLERGLYGLTAPPTPAQAARISADKLLVYQALLDAAQYGAASPSWRRTPPAPSACVCR